MVDPLKKWRFEIFLRLRYTSEQNLWMPWALTAVIEELDFKTRDILARGKKSHNLLCIQPQGFYKSDHRISILLLICDIWPALGLISVKKNSDSLFKLGFISEGQVNNPIFFIIYDIRSGYLSKISTYVLSEYICIELFACKAQSKTSNLLPHLYFLINIDYRYVSEISHKY